MVSGLVRQVAGEVVVRARVKKFLFSLFLVSLSSLFQQGKLEAGFFDCNFTGSFARLSLFAFHCNFFYYLLANGKVIVF